MTSKIKRDKHGEMKMQEMAFVLLAFALLAALVFIFFIKFQSGSIAAEAEELNYKRALSLRDKISSLPEMKCARINCIDKDKAEILEGKISKDLFQGLNSVRIISIYPEKDEIVIYDSGKDVGRNYPTYVNLCEQKKIGSTFDYDCGLALLLVGI